MKIQQAFVPVIMLIFFLTACQKDAPVDNKPPVVNAGRDSTYQLSTVNDTIQLSGSATDMDGQIVGYVWSQISGPNTAKILYPGSPSTKVSGVISGQYVFQLMATDDKGATGVKSVKIIVVRSAQLYTLNLQPGNNPTESSVYSYVPNGTGVGTPQIAIGAWTNGGTPVFHRVYLMFNYSIPAGATILNAGLSLYTMPVPLAGNFVDANYGTANSFSIQRITSPWSGNSISWNNQPSTTTANQVIVPNSTSSFQNSTDIDVTDLVKDMQQNGNNGFGMRLINEDYYNIRQYISSYNTDAAKRPKLVIQYSY